MRSWKKIVTIVLDIVLATYLVFAFTAFNKPDETTHRCTKVVIDIADETANGFINAKKIEDRLEEHHLYPLGQPMKEVNVRKIEDMLRTSPFVNTAECFKTQNKHVYISITQRMPVVRIKAANNDDYYLDDKDCIMPNSSYTSDLIIATGHINRWFATNYISILSKTLIANELWKNQIEQINILPDHGVELVPRVGTHIVYLGQMPTGSNKKERQELVRDFTERKMKRLEYFYKYGLSQAGWNKYSYINLEFDNQIICKKRSIQPDKPLSEPFQDQ